MKRLLLAAALLVGFGAGNVSAIGVPTDDVVLRDRLLACAIVEEARERNISLSRIRLTASKCLLAR